MIAGVRPEDLDISITRDMVTIRGKRERHTEGTNGDFFFQELYWGSFARTVVLPQEVEIEEAEATEKHGLLTIRLPKVDKGRQAKAQSQIKLSVLGAGIEPATLPSSGECSTDWATSVVETSYLKTEGSPTFQSEAH